MENSMRCEEYTELEPLMPLTGMEYSERRDIRRSFPPVGLVSTELFAEFLLAGAWEKPRRRGASGARDGLKHSTDSPRGPGYCRVEQRNRLYICFTGTRSMYFIFSVSILT